MKKWLVALGLTAALVLAGCNGDTEEGSDADTENQTEDTTENQENDEQQVKKELLSAQMALTNTFKPYQQKISAYKAAVSAEEPDAEAIQSAAEEAKKAASEAASMVDGYTIEAELPDDVMTKFEETLPSLQAYYEGVEKALNENMENADFTQAEEKFTEFNDQYNEILKEAGFPATPNLMEEMS